MEDNTVSRDDQFNMLSVSNSNDNTPNTFPDDVTRLVPIGSVEELNNLCLYLASKTSVITGVTPHENGIVYQIEVQRLGSPSFYHEFWINSYWMTKINQIIDSLKYEFTDLDDVKGIRELLRGGDWKIVGAKPLTVGDLYQGYQILFKNIYDNSLSEAIVNEYWYTKFHEAVREARSREVIPENSCSLKVDESTSRFSGAIWYEAIKQKTITLAGVGGIGSYVGFLLGRMKPALLIMYDPDIVEFANLSGQLYGKANIGEYKVHELTKMIKDYSDFYHMADYSERFTLDSSATDIMICGFDNMEARKMFFDVWSAHVAECTPEQRSKCLFIDGRLAAEEFQVITIQGDDERALLRYKSDWLFSDAEADATVCSYKQTTFMANMIASVMVNTFVNFVANECDPIIPRDVPFLVSYAADTMFFKVEM